MQLAIDLPDELNQALLTHADMHGFIVAAIKKSLLAEQQSTELLIDVVKDLPEIACFHDKDPLEIQTTLRDEWS